MLGHDFGSPVAAYCALLRPDVFRRVALMSAPFAGPPQRRSSSAPHINEALGKLDPPRKHYQWYYSTREADANMRDEVAGYGSFSAQQSAVRSITFHRAQMLASREANAATVAVQTKSVQSTRMQECGGSVRTVRTTAGWLLDGISIACS